MPLLGLFNSAVENKYERSQKRLAKGQDSSVALQGIKTDADEGRKQAFAQAYQARGNPALAQRQAQEANAGITNQQMQQSAQQRASDQQAAQGEVNRLDAQRTAGVQNAIGMGAQAAGMAFGGPLGGAAAGGAAQGMLPTGQAPTAQPAAPQAPQQAPQQVQKPDAFGGLMSSMIQNPLAPGGSMGGPETMSLLGGSPPTPPVAPPPPVTQPNIMSLVQGANAPRPTAPSAQGQQNVSWATQPMTEEERRRQGLLSDERMKEAARNGNPDARRFLDDLTNAMQGLRQTLPQELQASADKAIAMAQPEGFTGDTAPANESKDWRRPGTMFDNVEPQSFQYSAEGQQAGGAPGPQLGVMAQDVERFAPQMVNEDPMGNKRIDVNQGLSAVMAAQADLNQRIRRIEGDPLADIDSETADPLDNLRDTETPDLYNRPGNQRDYAADRPPARSRRSFAEGVRARVRPPVERTDSPLAPGEQPGRAEEERYGENSDFLRAFREFYGRSRAVEQSAEPAKGQLHGGNAVYPISEDMAPEEGRGNESNSRIRARAAELTTARRRGRPLPQAFPGTDYDLLNRLVGGSKFGRGR